VTVLYVLLWLFAVMGVACVAQLAVCSRMGEAPTEEALGLLGVEAAA
jgi:hypothetical protein